VRKPDGIDTKICYQEPPVIVGDALSSVLFVSVRRPNQQKQREIASKVLHPSRATLQSSTGIHSGLSTSIATIMPGVNFVQDLIAGTTAGVTGTSRSIPFPEPLSTAPKCSANE